MSLNRNLIAALVAASFLAFAPSVLAADAAKAPAKHSIDCKCATAPCPDCKAGKPCKCTHQKKACPDHKNLKKGEACKSKTPCADCKKENKKMASPEPKKAK